MKGCDYAWDRPNVQALTEAGITFACRYLGYDNTGKNLTAAEVQALHAAGIAVVLNFEYNPDGALLGRDQGVADATISKTQRAALGAPDSTPVYFSVDFNATATQLAGPIADYFRGVATILPVEQVGVYGGYLTVQTLMASGLVTYGWQTYAWSGGQWAHPHIRQTQNGVTIGGASVDIDESTVSNYGQWLGSTVDTPPPTTGGDPLMGWVTCSRATATRAQTLTVQGLLLARGYTDIGSRTGLPDGSWGDHTDASLRLFQVDYRVANSVTASGQGDGQVGANTLRALAGL